VNTPLAISVTIGSLLPGVSFPVALLLGEDVSDRVTVLGLSVPLDLYSLAASLSFVKFGPPPPPPFSPLVLFSPRQL
jgi:hypothetical protein